MQARLPPNRVDPAHRAATNECMGHGEASCTQQRQGDELQGARRPLTGDTAEILRYGAENGTEAARQRRERHGETPTAYVSACEWHVTHREHNRQMHALHGNGGTSAGKGAGAECKDDIDKLVMELVESDRADGGEVRTMKRIMAYLHAKMGAREGVEYEKDWLRERVSYADGMHRLIEAQQMEQERANETEPTEHAEAEMGGAWWSGDSVRIGEGVGSRRAWLKGKAGILRKSTGGIASGLTGGWNVEIEGEEGTVLVMDVATGTLSMVRRRAYAAGDMVDARTAVHAVDDFVPWRYLPQVAGAPLPNPSPGVAECMVPPHGPCTRSWPL